MKNNTRGEIITLITAIVVIFIGVATFVSTQFLKTSKNKIATNSRAMVGRGERDESAPAAAPQSSGGCDSSDYACRHPGPPAAPAAEREEKDRETAPAKEPSGICAVDPSDPDCHPKKETPATPVPTNPPSGNKAEKTERPIEPTPFTGPLPGDADKWKCPGPNCDKCGFAGWAPAGCQDFVAQHTSDAKYWSGRTSGPLSACGGAANQCTPGSRVQRGNVISTCGNDGCLHEESNTISTVPSTATTQYQFDQNTFNACLLKNPNASIDDCRNKANIAITPTPQQSSSIENLPFATFKTPSLCRNCEKGCESIGNGYWACSEDLAAYYPTLMVKEACSSAGQLTADKYGNHYQCNGSTWEVMDSDDYQAALHRQGIYGSENECNAQVKMDSIMGQRTTCIQDSSSKKWIKISNTLEEYQAKLRQQGIGYFQDNDSGYAACIEGVKQDSREGKRTACFEDTTNHLWVKASDTLEKYQARMKQNEISVQSQKYLSTLPPISVVTVVPELLAEKPENCKTDLQCGGAGQVVCRNNTALGFIQTGGYHFDACPGNQACVPGKGCADIREEMNKESPQGCDSPGSMQNRNGKFFVCTTTSDTQKYGSWIAVKDELYDKYKNGNKLTTGDVLMNALDDDDKFKLRNEGYYQAFWSNKTSAADKAGIFAMTGIDGLTHLIGKVTGVIGINPSFGNYAQSQLEIKNELAAKGLSYGHEIGFSGTPLSFTVAGPGEVLSTAAGGGLKALYRYTVIPGVADMVINALGGGTPINNLVERGNDAILTVGWNNDEKLKEAIKETQNQGIALTDVTALMVPGGKMIGGIGNRLSRIGTGLTELEGAGRIIGRPAGTILKLTGESAQFTGKGLETLSPESWLGGGFIRSQPITSRAEAIMQAAKDTLPAKGAQLAVKTADFIETKVPGGSKIISVGNAARDLATSVGESGIGRAVGTAVQVPVTIGKVAGKVASELLLPRSALTYGVDDAAKVLARDVKLGLTDEAGALGRLQSKYHVSLSPSEVNQFNKSFSKALKTSSPSTTSLSRGGSALSKVDNWLNKLNDSPLKTQADATNIAKNIRSQLDFNAQRAQLIAQRVEKVAQTEAKGGALRAADKAAIKDLGKEFKNIKNTDELAEAIAGKWEQEAVATKGKFSINPSRPIQLNADDLTLAKRYAEEIAGQRSNIVSKATNNVRDYFRPKAQVGFETGAYDGIGYGRAKNGESVIKLQPNTRSKAFVNGEEVVAGKPQVLKPGDKVIIQRPHKPSLADEEYVFKGMSPVDPTKRTGKQKFSMEYKVPPDHNQPLGKGGNRQFELAGQKKSFAKANQLKLEDVHAEVDPTGNNIKLFNDGTGKISKQMPDGSLQLVTGKGAEMKVGDVFDFGGQKMKVVETPGKSWYLVDEAGKRAAVQIKSGGIMGEIRDRIPFIENKKSVVGAAIETKKPLTAKGGIYDLTADKKFFTKRGNVNLDDVHVSYDPVRKEFVIFEDGRVIKGTPSDAIYRELPNGARGVFVDEAGVVFKDGDIFNIGGQRVKAVVTPGKGMYFVDLATGKSTILKGSEGLGGRLADLRGKDKAIKAAMTSASGTTAPSLGQKIRNWLQDPFGRRSTPPTSRTSTIQQTRQNLSQPVPPVNRGGSAASQALRQKENAVVNSIIASGGGVNASTRDIEQALRANGYTAGQLQQGVQNVKNQLKFQYASFAQAEIGKLTPRKMSDFGSTGSWNSSNGTLQRPYWPENRRGKDLIKELTPTNKSRVIEPGRVVGGQFKKKVYNYAITDDGHIFVAPQKDPSVVREAGVKHIQVAAEALNKYPGAQGIVRSGEMWVNSNGELVVNLSSGTFSDYGSGVWGQRWAQTPQNMAQLQVIFEGILGVRPKVR